jgi:hypothetical protein
MRAERRIWATAVLGVCLVGTPLLWLRAVRSRARSLVNSPVAATSSPPPGQFDTALREAGRWQYRAAEAVDRQMDELAEREPDRLNGTAVGDYRRLFMARSPDILRAERATQRAMVLARTSSERFRAAALLSRLECNLGRHARELQQARLLMSLQPHNPVSLRVLDRAAKCNGLKLLSRRVEAELKALESRQGSRAARPDTP